MKRGEIMNSDTEAQEILQVCQYLSDDGYTLTYVGKSGVLTLNGVEPYIWATKGSKTELQIRIYAPDRAMSAVIRRVLSLGDFKPRDENDET